jgi:hypothetical protein
MVNISENSPMYYVVYDITRDLLVAVVTMCSKMEYEENQKLHPDEERLEVLDSTWRKAMKAMHEMVDFETAQKIHTQYETIFQDIKYLSEESQWIK